jgi:hypothetical protein
VLFEINLPAIGVSPSYRFSPNGSWASTLIVVSGHSLTLSVAVVDNSDFTGKGDITKKNMGVSTKMVMIMGPPR